MIRKLKEKMGGLCYILHPGSISGIVVWGIGLIYVTSAITYSLSHNYERITPTSHTVSKANGFSLCHTKVTYEKDDDETKIEVEVDGVFNRGTSFSRSQSKTDTRDYAFIHGSIDPSVSLTDDDGDGLVDRINKYGSFSSPNSSMKLERDKDFEKYKGEFERADKMLAEPKDRFSEYLKPKSSQ